MAVSGASKLLSRLRRREDHEEDSPEWANRARFAIMEKLSRDRPEALNILKQALKSPHLTSECVPLPKTKDGRMQVFAFKRFPHYISCKVWRWPDLKSHYELNGIPCCTMAFSKRKLSEVKEICINPYHYQRVNPEDCGLPPPTYSFEMLPPYTQDNPQLQSAAVDPMDYSLDCKTDMSASFASLAISEEKEWATIRYHELKCRVGESCICKGSEVCVDGLTSINSNNRFSLGTLSNINRDQGVEKVRAHIGKGISFIYEEGRVYLKNNGSNTSIFLNSHFANFDVKLLASEVWKVLPGLTVKVFDSQLFDKLLQSTRSKGYESVQELTKMCSARVAFIKGWGNGYQRMEVFDTPCWIEIHFHEGLTQVDEMLKEIGKPTSEISSWS